MLFISTTQKIRADIQSILDQYDIADKASQRQYITTLMSLDFLLGNYDEALSKSEMVRALEEKPADKLLSALRLRAMAAAAKKTGSINTPEYFALVGKEITKQLDSYPYSVIANDIKSYKASAELMGEGPLLGGVKDVLQKTVDKNGGNLSLELASELIYIRYALETTLPLKKTLISVYTAYLEKTRSKKQIFGLHEILSLQSKAIISL